MKHKKRIPLRVYYAKSTLFTLLIACIIACGFVCLGVTLFYHREFTIIAMLISCVIICFLTCLIGGHMLMHRAEVFINPIEEVNRAVNEVATGDFKIQAEGSHNATKIDELETLVENFNNMAKELDGMDYMRKDFMSNVSHEIKTPIAAITGFAEILKAGGLSQNENQEYLNLIYDEAARLSRICESMLAMSRLDNQTIVRKHDSIRIDEQIRKTVILMAEKWEHKAQEFELDLEETVINSDSDLLSQVWMNVIDNAMKYSDDGSTIYIKLKKISESKNLCRIIIRDEGEGIPPDKVNRIFDKFYQCDESHKKQGSGLGLSIVKRIIQLLGGTIYCKSEPGKGTSMIIELG